MRRRPTSRARSRWARVPNAAANVFETTQAYVCEKAVGPDKTCDFRSGRVILQRPVERAQMQKLLASGKTDLLQFVSARTRRPFSAFLVRQPDGKIGFEFEARDPSKPGGRRGARGAPAALRVLGAHPKDGKPVEIFAGRYGPYVKHGAVNATLRDRERVDALTLDEALALLAEKTGKEAPAKTRAAPRKPAATAELKAVRSKRAPAKPKAAPRGSAKPRPKPAAPKTRAKTTKKK